MGGVKKSTLIEGMEWVLVVFLFFIAAFSGCRIVNNSKEVREAVDMKDTKLVLYEGPKSLKLATADDLIITNENLRDYSIMGCTDTTIRVNGYDLYVYDTNVNHSRQWSQDYLPPQARTPITYFDFEGIVEIEVSVPNIELETVKISPVSYGIIPKIDTENHKVSFTITEPDTYTLTFNNSPARAVHIFANSLETEIPSEGEEGVIFIGPGEWDIETIMLEDNQTLYISGGAVIHGIIQGNYAKNVKVMGRGIIDGSNFEGWLGKAALVPLKFDYCDGVEIRDVLVLNSNAWVCSAEGSKDGAIDGLKIISSRPNGDGITLQSCQNFVVQNSFVRSWDDSLVVKNYSGNSENIIFQGIQLWTDFAQSMEIGYETNKGNREMAKISNIKFENITVLNNFHKPVVSVHNADDALVTDIVFRDIVVENAQMGSGDGTEAPYLIDLNIVQNSNWSTTKERGQIKGVMIDGVKVLSGKFNPSRINGYDETYRVEDVTIRKLEILGEQIDNFEQGKFEINHSTTNNLVIK